MPHVRLRPMTAEEYDEWLPWVTGSYAEEVAVRVGGDLGAARALSEASMRELLPQGLDTPDHSLLIGEGPDGGRVGYLWFGPSTDDATRAWLYDIWVDEPHRGRGFGGALLEAFESEARERGFTGVGLNVFAYNTVALHLYGSHGYAEIARQMHKDL